MPLPREPTSFETTLVGPATPGAIPLSTPEATASDDFLVGSLLAIACGDSAVSGVVDLGPAFDAEEPPGGSDDGSVHAQLTPPGSLASVDLATGRFTVGSAFVLPIAATIVSGLDFDAGGALYALFVEDPIGGAGVSATASRGVGVVDRTTGAVSQVVAPVSDPGTLILGLGIERECSAPVQPIALEPTFTG